ncbi:MAG: hypothetical protein HQ539_00790 [Parcubacteria group bacterium]|nr:hypothetical protein [Parcubacteria group bacterium]
MDFRKILNIAGKSAYALQTVEIYYPKTENVPAGWREIEPYSLSTDIGLEGEHLVWGEDLLSPGHILNAYTVDTKDDHCDSFIVGKIREVRKTNNKFKPRNNWKVEF